MSDGYWDGQVQQDDVDLATGVYEAADPLTAGEPDAFPRYLQTPGNPLDGGPAAPSFGGTALPPLPADPVAAELSLLQQIRDGTLGTASHLAVSEEAPNSITRVHYPIPGVERWLIPRVPIGGQVAVAEAVFGEVLSVDHGRIGGTIVNSGAKAVVLALSSLLTVTGLTGRIYLAAEGGSWDLRLSDVTWVGGVCAEARGGASQLEVVAL